MGNFSRYSAEVGGVADELLGYLSGANYPNAKRIFENIGLQGLSNMSQEDHDAAVKFLEQTPSARDKKIQKIGGREAFALLIRARYVALSGARLIAVADRFDMIPGMSYRRAAAFAANQARRLQPLTEEDILPPHR